VLPELGRTCRKNGNSGLYHGHGRAVLELGGSINGGKNICDKVELR